MSTLIAVKAVRTNMDISYITQALGVLFLSWLTYLVGLVIYRLYFHPLAKFPGPKYAAISRWHEYYHEVVRKGQFTFVIQDYHKQYGMYNIPCTIDSKSLCLFVWFRP